MIETAYRGRLIGLELEFFIVDGETLEPRDCLDRLSRHSSFGIHVKPEAVHEQIEFCSAPFTSIAELEAQVRELCAEAIALLATEGAVLLPLALLESAHFTWSAEPRVRLLNQTLGTFFRDYAGSMAADQINLGATDAADACRIFNRFRGFAGDFVALGAASPLRDGVGNDIASNRLDVYDTVLRSVPDKTGLPPRLASSEDLSGFVERNSLFGEPGSCYTYLRPRPERGVSVELRCIDKQPTLAETLALAAVAKAIMLSDFDPDAAETLSANALGTARKRGVIDTTRTCALIAHLRQFLPVDEQSYLDRFKRGAEFVPAWRRLLTSHRRLGMRGMRRELAHAFVEEIAEVGPP